MYHHSHSLFLRSLLSIVIGLTLAPIVTTAATPSPPTQGNPANHAPPAGAPSSITMITPLMDIKGVVSWNTLAKVKQLKTKDRILPDFSKEITALNDKEIKLQGFMMPLEPGEKQQHFLLSVNPQTCSYCLPAGPEGVVEIKTRTPIKYTFDPVVISGKMSILKDDPMGLYYRVTDASLSPLK